MDILKNLFYGFPDLWGGGVAHSVLILALVITLGLSLGKLRVKGVSLGLAWSGLLRLPIDQGSHKTDFLRYPCSYIKLCY
jgi:hypothetical protein